ncbi:MAG: hypothetical protein H6701_16765, partial [Myxococcales bacterium]|nr:hypothetical protein [Myxococcales bacterium]
MQGRVHHPLFDHEPDDAEREIAAGATLGGRSTPARLQSDALRDALHAEDHEAIDRLEALWDAGRVPTAAELLPALAACTAEQRAALAADAAFIDRVVDACDRDGLPEVLQALADDPVALIHHYACRKHGHDPDALVRLIALASFEERQRMIASNALCERLHDVFGDIDPDALFGADIAAWIDTDPMAIVHLAVNAPAYLAWRQRADRIDTRALLARLAQSPEALRAGLDDPQGAWAQLVAHAPRGDALDEDSRDHLDHIALDMPSALSPTQLREAFEIRFGRPFDEDTTQAADAEDIRAAWEHLARGAADPRALRRAGGAPWHAWLLADLFDDLAARAIEAEDGSEEDAEDIEETTEALVEETADATHGTADATHGTADATHRAAAATRGTEATHGTTSAT